MNLTVLDEKNSNKRNRIHPKKFALYLSFASIVMMFIGLTSAYVVRKAAGNWYEFSLPNIFFVSTAVILLSSLTLQMSYNAFIKGNPSVYRWMMVASFVLGFVFVILQYMGWQTLQAYGVDLKGNPSGSFVYALSGLHAAHVLGGLGALAVALIHAFKLRYKVNPIRKLRFEMTLYYWHFVDILWIYLLVFLMFA